MCGNIKKLRFADRPATSAEIDAAILQYVRKISDLRQPSTDNQKLWDQTRTQMAKSMKKLLDRVTSQHMAAVKQAKFSAC